MIATRFQADSLSAIFFSQVIIPPTNRRTVFSASPVTNWSPRLKPELQEPFAVIVDVAEADCPEALEGAQVLA